MELSDALEIQRELKRVAPGFPKNCCSLAAKEVHDKFGYKPVSGFVFTSKGPEEHSWNEDGEGNIVDLTLHQFNDFKDHIFVKIPWEDAAHKYGHSPNGKMTDSLERYIKGIPGYSFNFLENF